MHRSLRHFNSNLLLTLISKAIIAFGRTSEEAVTALLYTLICRLLVRVAKVLPKQLFCSRAAGVRIRVYGIGTLRNRQFRTVLYDYGRFAGT